MKKNSSIKISPLDNPIFNTMIEIRIYDINYGNHLGHDSLISLLHEARMRFLNALGYSELNIEGIGILVNSLAINYISQAFYLEKLAINIGINNLSTTSLELKYQVLNIHTGKEIARAITLLTFYDNKKNKIKKIPEKFLHAIKANYISK